jgi:phage terminase large subunit GpA-like protein
MLTAIEQQIYDNIQPIIDVCFEPLTKLKVSEWADNYRYLSPEASSVPGKWTGLSFQNGMMDWLNDPEVETIVLMTSAQVGKTEVLLNCIGFIADQDPGPVLFVMPNLDEAEDFSKDRLSTMFRDTPCLQDKISPAKVKNSDNSLLHKRFRGGYIKLVGSNSTAGLAGRPIRWVLCDEVDRFKTTTEGDPISLAFKRTTTFFNRKKLLTSTPTLKDFSRIEKWFEEGDQCYYFVPCTHCGEYQRLQWDGEWEGVRWDQKAFNNEAEYLEYKAYCDENNIYYVQSTSNKWKVHLPNTAYYTCKHCQCVISNTELNKMVENGEWRSTKPMRNGIKSAHIWEIYNPYVTLARMVTQFLKDKNRPDTLMTFINTVKGETYEDYGEKLSDSELYNRREAYKAEVPDGVGILTAGVDVQDDRIEISVIGWGKDNESWVVDHNIIYGDLGDIKKGRAGEIWNRLNAYLHSEFEHESGRKIKIQSVCIDIGGHHTDETYNYCYGKQSLLHAIQGHSRPGKRFVEGPTKKGLKNMPVYLFQVNVSSGKDTLYRNLKAMEPCPGYVHFTNDPEKKLDLEYFKQLTAEKVVTTWKDNVPKREYVKRRHRNEALDCFVYAMAALTILTSQGRKDMVEKYAESLSKPLEEEKEIKVVENKKQPTRRSTGKNWVTGW